MKAFSSSDSESRSASGLRLGEHRDAQSEADVARAYSPQKQSLPFTWGFAPGFYNTRLQRVWSLVVLGTRLEWSPIAVSTRVPWLPVRLRTRLQRVWLLLLLVGMAAGACHAQRHSTALSETEEEAVRDAADDPAKRVAVYQSIIETRVKRIQDILADKRAQGRREDIRENMDEIAGLVDELEDNLDEYDGKHRDLRKPLPRLLDATLRWESVLKQPPVDERYDLVRRLALEAVGDIKKEAGDMLPAEQAYFKAHPPDKNANPGGVGEIRRRE